MSPRITSARSSGSKNDLAATGGKSIPSYMSAGSMQTPSHERLSESELKRATDDEARYLFRRWFRRGSRSKEIRFRIARDFWIMDRFNREEGK